MDVEVSNSAVLSTAISSLLALVVEEAIGVCGNSQRLRFRLCVLPITLPFELITISGTVRYDAELRDVPVNLLHGLSFPNIIDDDDDDDDIVLGVPVIEHELLLLMVVELSGVTAATGELGVVVAMVWKR